MNVVVAIDSFKEFVFCRSRKCSENGILRCCPDGEVKICPLADGGEGTVRPWSQVWEAYFAEKRLWVLLAVRWRRDMG